MLLNNKYIVKMIISFVLIGSSTFATENDILAAITVKGALIKKAEIAIEGIKEQIVNARSKAHVCGLQQAHKDMLTLQSQHSEDIWQTIIGEKKTYCFKGQTAFDSLAGELFHINDVDEYLMCPQKKHLLSRIDNIWTLAIAAYHKNPMAEFMMTWIMKSQWNEYNTATKENPAPKFFNEHFKNSIETMALHLDNPEVCFILGISKVESPHIGNKYYTTKEEKELFLQGKELQKNRFALLYYCSWDEQFEPLIELAEREQFAPAYIQASEITDDINIKLQLIKKAIKLGYSPAYIDLAAVLIKKYHDKPNNLQKEEIISNLRQASKDGVTNGYISEGIFMTGNIINDPTLDGEQYVAKFTDGDYTKALVIYKKAADLNDLQGHEYMVKTLELQQKYQKKDLRVEIFKVLIEGIRLGSDSCYWRAHTKSYKQICMLLNKLNSVSSNKLYENIINYYNSLSIKS